ncbi:E3 ubiquitin-protein ligase [Hordeum vulgare]|nr:E3 ubiquitin-protein ligase [Hordeum vulgare]
MHVRAREQEGTRSHGATRSSARTAASECQSSACAPSTRSQSERYLDHMATVCTRCDSKDYTRSRAVARMVGSVLFACRNRQHGCAASLPRHVVEEHERSCRYEPCFFPACQRPFFPGVDDSAQERHIAGHHDWLLHRLTYGKDVLVDVDPDRLALIRAHDRIPRLVPHHPSRSSRRVDPIQIQVKKDRGLSRQNYRGFCVRTKRFLKVST